MWGLTYQIIADQSGYSIPHLVEKFQEYLDTRAPPIPVFDQSRCEQAYLLMDGLWFGRWFVLMVYRQSEDLIILHIAVVKKEWGWKISQHLQTLKNSGYRFGGIVSDGGTGVVSAIHEIYPHTPHQICLFHMYQNVIKGLGKRPKDYHLQELRRLADHVWLIESKEALRWWRDQVRLWKRHNLDYLTQRRKDTEGKSWYIHTGARKAVAVMEVLPQTSFTFLGRHKMPKTTNEIEAQFGHLGKRWLAHRGLKQQRWESFLQWFIYFYNHDKLASSKLKTAGITNTKS